MARKNKNNASENLCDENQDKNISEAVVDINDSPNIEIFDDSKQKETEVLEQDTLIVEEESAIEAAIKEYNGEIRETNPEEKRIRIRDAADIGGIRTINKKKIIIIASIIFAIIISFVAVAVINKMNSKVYRNVYLGETNLTGMTSVELTEVLREKQANIQNTTLKIFQDKELILEIVPSDINFEIDMAAVEKEIFGFGRASNVFKNNIDIIWALVCKKEMDLIYKYDVSKLTDIVKEIKASLDNKVIDDSYIVDENQYKLIITRGKSGNTIDEEVVKNKIIQSLANGIGEYTLKIVEGTPAELDIDVVYSNVKRDAEDAYIDKSLTVYKFVPHKVGLDFDKDELKNILLKKENMEENKVIEYPLTVIEPNVKTSDIKWEMYEYQISSFTTHFSTADPNRVNNLRVALNLINGKTIMPGETFSYNSIVGGATAAQGFKAAATFVGGRVVNEVGGGICQTVSTLYNTVLLANLEIVQRKAHSLPVAYVPASRDATVYYPSIDFKFKNTREYPIKIVTSFNANGSLTISLYGTKQENEYVVSITSKKLSIIEFKDTSINDSTLEKGKHQVVQAGTNGYTSEAYITKKLNGKVVSTTLLSRDTYKPVNRIIKVGTKEVPVVMQPDNNDKINNSESNAGNNEDSSATTTPDTSVNTNTGSQNSIE